MTAELPCGCRSITKDGTVTYLPCLACALQSAGAMLQQAGLRLAEQRDRELEAARELHEQMRARAEDYIGGSD